MPNTVPICGSTSTPVTHTNTSDLNSAIRVAQRMLAEYGDIDIRDLGRLNQAYGAHREALRILLRALGAEPVDEQEAIRRSVDAQFPAVAAFLADERGEGK